MDWLLPFLQIRPEGLYVPACDAYLDPAVPVRRTILTRAHPGRTPGDSEEIWATAPTLALSKLLHPQWKGDQRRIDRGSPIEAGGISIELFESGHILGSTQIRFSNRETSLLYTGSLHRGAGRTTAPAESPPSRTLVIDATFGLPVFRFPPRAALEADLVAFCRQAFESEETPILLADSLGKTQEAAAILQEARIPTVWHHDAWLLREPYEAAGFRFPLARSRDSGPPVAGEALFWPPQDARSTAIRTIKKRRVMYLSGWAVRSASRAEFDADRLLPLSSHADFLELLEHVRALAPDRVATGRGYAGDFARILREQSIAAQAIDDTAAKKAESP